MENRYWTTVLTSSMDHSRWLLQEKSVPTYILVIGATSRVNAVDVALRNSLRFGDEVFLGFPDENEREEILSVLVRNVVLERAVNLKQIAMSTRGFVAADLADVVEKAGTDAMERMLRERKLELHEHGDDWWRVPPTPEKIDKLVIKMSDFEKAVNLLSGRAEFSSIPNVMWEDVGGLTLLKQELENYIVSPIKSLDVNKEFRVDLETGFLLYGPPGCGKTLIAKAVANEAGANFIHIRGTQLLQDHVGESELAVQALFARARRCAPCIILFDEVDALTIKSGEEGGWAVELLKQLLVELDGAEQRQGVFVIGATNRLEAMDDTILRAGRLGKCLHVPLPSPDERGLILEALVRRRTRTNTRTIIDGSVDLRTIGRMEATENFSGADLNKLVGEAVLAAFKEKFASRNKLAALKEKLASTEEISDVLTINVSHFEIALPRVTANRWW